MNRLGTTLGVLAHGVRDLPRVGFESEEEPKALVDGFEFIASQDCEHPPDPALVYRA